MYNLPYYKEPDFAGIRELIEKYPFAFLSGADSKHHPVATQVPLFLTERDSAFYLQGHIMRNTDHHKAFETNPNVLAIFTGPNTYVSATWYSNPFNGSTWNYMSVHVKGTIRFLQDAQLEDMLRKLSSYFENGNTDTPTYFDNLPKDYKNRVMPAIIGFEIAVTKIDNVFKLSQDRDKESYLNIISQLKERESNSRLIAEEMEKRFSALFPS